MRGCRAGRPEKGHKGNKIKIGEHQMTILGIKTVIRDVAELNARWTHSNDQAKGGESVAGIGLSRNPIA